MDVLQYYSPPIPWANFKQGQISDIVWQAFGEVVTLCHAYNHWRDEARDARHQPASSLYPESAYAKRKRRRDAETSVSINETRMYRCAFLAAELVLSMTAAAQHHKYAPDLALCEAMNLAIGHNVLDNRITGHERADWPVLALTGFDADVEMSASPIDVATRWRK